MAPSNPKTRQRQASQGRFPTLPVVFGVVAIAAVLAIAFSGSSGDGGSTATEATTAADEATSGGGELGQPAVSGDALPPVLDSNPDEPAADPAFGLPIPEVAGQDFDGGAVEITRNGKPKAILFVSHSCPHCQAEIPAVKEWLDTGPHLGDLEIVTVSVGANPQAANWPPSEWFRREGWQLPVVADDEEATVFNAFGGYWVPYWVFADSEGNVIDRHFGSLGISEMEATIQQLAG